MHVNICMITYNHGLFIRQAIESILHQQTDFTYRLVIGEDRSTDQTRAVCQEFAEKFPDRIQLISSGSNVGMMENFLRTYRACTGDFIAYCEGDDYWTDPGKLQQQVNFLQENPEYSSCFHNVVIDENINGRERQWVLHEALAKDSFTTADILGPWFIPSPSFVFRNYTDFILPDWFRHCVYGDLPFMLLLTLRGPVKYLPEIMAVYRKHEKGMSEVHKAYDKIMVMAYVYTSFDIHTGFRFHPIIRDALKYEIERHAPPASHQMKDNRQPPEYISLRTYIGSLRRRWFGV